MKTKIWLRNTLGKTQTHVKDIVKTTTVNVYACGPTVYDYAHIGNFRSFLTSDILVRVLKYAGFKVNKVMNITDVGHLTGDDLADASGEDKLIKKAIKEGEDPLVIAKFYEKAFMEDEEFLRIEKAFSYPRATDFIDEQIEITQECLKKNMAYVANGSVYFKTAEYENYGSLSGNKLEGIESGARVEKNPEKENPEDFALWKKAPENHLLQWDSPWGKGFPGWHVECSAMSHAILGEVHIHTGGEDNIFPHHECEMAQNHACGYAEIPLWVHTKHLLIDGAKMSKSKGNFYTIKDLKEQGWRGAEIRIALLSGHYRSSLNFSQKSLHQARVLVARIRNAKNLLEAYPHDGEMNLPIDHIKEKFQEALIGDLNTPEALALVSVLLKATMPTMQDGKLSQKTKDEVLDFFAEDVDPIFAIMTPDPDEMFSKEDVKTLEKLIKQRKTLRDEKKYDEADVIRVKIEALGAEVLDTPDGTLFRKAMGANPQT